MVDSKRQKPVSTGQMAKDRKLADDGAEALADGLATGERPTLKTISRLSGLAVPTVSRALSDAPDIGQRTKERVQAIAQQIGYRPNRAGLRLRTGKTQVISLVISTDHDVMNQTARLICSIAEGLRGTSYHLNVNPAFPDNPMEPVRYIVESGSADGIIMNATLPDDPRIHYLRRANFPFVTHGRSLMAEEHAYFDFDHHACGRLVIGELARRKRRSVLLIPPPHEENYSQDLMRGSREEATACNLVVRVLEGAHGETSMEQLEVSIKKHIERFPDTDAIFCSSTTAALSTIATLDSAGLEVGREVDVCTREIIPLLGRFRPGILTVSEDVSLAGEFLSRAMIHAIRAPDEMPMQGLEVPVKINVYVSG